MRAVTDEYRQWRDLGPGGLPANPAGWVTSAALRLWSRDATTTRPPHARTDNDFTLPARSGARPPVAPYPIPHRQIGAAADGDRIRRLGDHLESWASPAGPLVLRRSRLERHGQALYVDDYDRAPAWIRRTRGEIAHVHGAQGSLHVVTAPGDADEIVGQGWGERHPLAGRRLLGLPDTYLLLYAPRDDAEHDQIERIVARVAKTALRSA